MKAVRRCEICGCHLNSYNRKTVCALHDEERPIVAEGLLGKNWDLVGKSFARQVQRQRKALP